ncbi:hypothetical protein NHL50_05445 [Acidimicrobiia bacterium EGI L10123]|uniref:hypothetical protein n=1 Tax=Salinilacustrithrix flava TaxID=2957203 RepID=UPI003D7C1C81|nr:hypothetical protein [Acidimicrobiia bacterium EGI L10123]
MAQADTTDAAELDDAPKGGFGSLGSIIGLLALTWAAGLAAAPLNDNSFFTHLATGRLILDEGRVPSNDPYTYTAAGEPWTVQSWLASVAYASVERLAGPLGLRLLLLVVFGLAAWLLWRLTEPATSLLVRFGLVTAALLVATGLWSERPYMVGVIGIALVWLALEGRVPWWAMLPLLWIWGNAHGSFVLAPVLVVLVLLGAALDRRSRRWADVTDHERRVTLAVLAGTVLVAAGPLGLRALTFPLVAAQRSDVFGEVTEWQAPQFRSPSELAYLVFVVLAFVVLARWGRSWRLILPAAAFVGASLYAQRNIVIATVILVAVCARSAPTVGSLQAGERPRLGRPAAVIVAVLLALIAASTLLTPPSAVDDYAAAPIAWLDSTGVDGHLANDVLNGNLLEVLDGPEQAVFIDDRFDVLPDDVFEDYLRLLRGGPGWQEALERRDVETVLWGRSTPLASLLRESDAWRVTFSDARWVVAERR